MPASCDRCGGTFGPLAVCGACGRHATLDAPARIRHLTPVFDEQDTALTGGDPIAFDGYPDALAEAREATGAHEAARWGWADIEGIGCALLVVDFEFLGGSMGLAVGEKVARAFDAARRRKLPVVAVTASGGARMQEGMVALAQMAKTVEARRRHARAGLAQVSILTSPTTGGVYASFATLADAIIAEPDAMVGFAGPRVVEELTGTRPSPETQTAEFAFTHGQVDAIVPRTEQPAVVGTLLRNLTRAPTNERPAPPMHADLPAHREEPDAWERLQRARDPNRPKARAILDALLEDAVELRGDRQSADDPAIVVRLGVLGGVRVCAIGQDASGDARIRPAGFRKAIRALELAGRAGLPVLTLIDTRGADPLPSSEADGLVPAIARTFLVTLDCPTPTLAVVTGEGGSGGALAMAPCDRLLVWEHAVFSVIAPEGAASILYRDTEQAPELAQRLRIAARDLVELGIADAVVREPPAGAQADPATALGDLRARVGAELADLVALPNRSRLARRRARWRGPGKRWITGH